MRIHSKFLSVLWKIGVVGCAFTGVALQIGLFRGELHLSSFRYFTNLSNLLCLLYFLIDAAWILARRTRDGSQNWFPALKGAAMMGVVVTCLVANFLLGSFTMGTTMRIAVRLVHLVVPIMTVLDWLLFDEKGAFTWRSPLGWTIFPLGYFGSVLLLAAVLPGVPFYPYPFMNVSARGLTPVLVTVAVLTAFFIALGALFLWIDRLLAKAGRRRLSA